MTMAVLLQDVDIKVLRITQSVCPMCMTLLTAYVLKKDNLVYLEKNCVKHGKFSILVSEYADEYMELCDFYFDFVPQRMPQKEYYIHATTQCNIACSMCFLDFNHSVVEMSLERIKQLSNIKGIKRFTFSHGEATTCDNLFEMIRILKKSRKIVNMHTNGIKIADFEYASSLKSAGINQVSLQFDGFDEKSYIMLRSRKLLNYKLKALKNMEKLAIPVTLNVTVARGVNECDIGRIFDYALRHTFIKDVSFITYSNYEQSYKNVDKYIMPDELLRYMEVYTQKRITRHNIILFQKLFYAYISVFKKRKCFYYYHYLIIRNGGVDYITLDEFLNLNKIVNMLDNIRRKKSKLGHLKFLSLLFISLRIRSVFLLPVGIITLLKGGFPKKPTRFMVITFATICDPYKYDLRIANNCGQGICTFNKIHESYGAYLINNIMKQ